jgi:tight adherence protein C
MTPIDLNARINEQLVLAGNPAGWDAERVVAVKILAGVIGAVIGALLVALIPLPALVKLVFVVLFAVIGYLFPSVQLRAMARRRQLGIRRELSDVMDLLTISVEAGMGLDAAIAQVTRNVPGALSEELARLSQEIQIGVSRAEAFRHLADRTKVQELRGFVLSMIQAELFASRSRTSCVPVARAAPSGASAAEIGEDQ